MLRQPPWTRRVARAFVVAAVAVVVVGCGQTAKPDPDAKAQHTLTKCRAEWKDVADTVMGLDQDPNPSALAARWTTLIATIDYYRSADRAQNCQETVDTQLKAATALRQFSEKLRPYDMTYQLQQVRAAVDLYVNDPLPEPARDANHKLVRPPGKDAVSAAMKTLTDNAEQANEELEPGWEQTKSVDLGDVAALTKTMQDLDFLAQDSPHWRRCEEALQVIVAAIRFQEGTVGDQPDTPSQGASQAPTEVPSASPSAAG